MESDLEQESFRPLNRVHSITTMISGIWTLPRENGLASRLRAKDPLLGVVTA